MIRTLIAALTIFLLGPGLAYAALALGCDANGGGIPLVCGHNVLLSFVGLTVIDWLLMSTAWVLVQSRSKDF